MILFMQSLIMGFCFAGVYGLADEWGGDKTQPLFWMIFFVLGLSILLVVRKFPEVVVEERMAIRFKHEEEDYQKRLKRLKGIQEICNRNMRTGESKIGLRVKDHIVVPYEDLLRIWDQADRIQFSE